MGRNSSTSSNSCSRRRERGGQGDHDDDDELLSMKQQQQHAKFFNRIMSKDIATPNPSFRVYYGGAPGSVPFTWESAPGTPKHDLFSSDSSNLPPLTPPPSFYSSSKDFSRHRFRSSAAMKLPNFLFRVLFPETTTTTTAAASSRGLRSSATSSYSSHSDLNSNSNCSLSYSSSTSSSSSGLFPTSTADVYRKKPWRGRCFSCSRLPVNRRHGNIVGNDDADELEEEEGRRRSAVSKRIRSVSLGRWYPFERMKNALFSVEGGRW